ncbi:hypothetical protein Tco_1376232 [Tanacetum coccineum]
MWKAIKRLKQGESINVQDLETNLYWEFGKFTSRDGETLESYYSRFYKMINELVKNQCDVTNHQVNVQFLLQLQLEWQRWNRSLGFSVIVARNIGMQQENIQEVTPNVANNSRPIFDAEPLQKVQNNDDNYNVFANDREHLVQHESVNDTYPDEQGDTNITTDSLDNSNNGGEADYDDDDLARERDLWELTVSFNEYTQKINDLNQTISEMKKELIAHQETIFIISQEKEAQNKFYKTREDKEIEKVTALENKVKVLDDIVYKTGQSVQTMNMLNRNCKISFVKLEFIKKAQRANPRLYDMGFYNDNLALILRP